MQTMIPEARLTSPAFLLPGAMDALQSLGKVVQRAGVPAAATAIIASAVPTRPATLIFPPSFFLD